MRPFSNRLVALVRRAVEWGDRRVPWGLRSVVGLLLMGGGVLGFLPVLGFWMLPIGLAFIALDIPPLRRRLLAWLRRRDPARPGAGGCGIGGGSIPRSSPHVRSIATDSAETPMTDPTAAAAGRFKVGGDIAINRLGFGAMRVTGAGVWGPPADRAEALRALRRLPELGVNFIDTADSYGPGTSEELIREALHPYDGLLIATKGGLERPAPGQWVSNGRPDYLRGCVQASLRRLGVPRIDLWQLHRVDPKVPRDEQFGVIKEMRAAGLIRHVGLSNVSLEELAAAQRFFPVATVQNRYNLVDRGSEAVLDACAQQGIGFIPWYPLAAGDLAKPGAVLDAIARKHKASAGQVALAWLLKRSPAMLPIPGTSKVKHLEENVAAASIKLSDEEFRTLDEQGRKAA
jgi:aryl-alcohol dehydrogenase-like predicted oxidoreductase